MVIPNWVEMIIIQFVVCCVPNSTELISGGHILCDAVMSFVSAFYAQ